MLKLCAIFAHPDDESFSAGGALARYASSGVQVTLVTATSGGAGEVGSAAVKPEGLAAWRERELHEAAAVLGVHDVRLLRLPDGTLAERSTQLQALIAELLEEVEPHVALTEDVQGITGHPDHIAVAEAVVRAFDDLGEAAPLKLYEHVLPQSMTPPGIFGTPDHYVTTTLDVERWREQQVAALRAHHSQVDEAMLERFAGFPPPMLAYFICVRSRVPILIPEHDLFAGVPG
jgi:LmbE family N-acetylglucosaminyl deacetylase